MVPSTSKFRLSALAQYLRCRRADHVSRKLGTAIQSKMPLGLCSNFANLRSSSLSIPTPSCMPKLARVRDDAFTERLARGVVGSKSPVDVIVIRKRFCQRLRLCPGFGDAKTDVRTWRRGRIAHQCHAAENQAGQPV